MDIIDIKGLTAQKAAKLPKERSTVSAERKPAKKEADSVNVSSKAKLLNQLRKAYGEMEKNVPPRDLAEVKEKLPSLVHMSSEEIVAAILEGTFFGGA